MVEGNSDGVISIESQLRLTVQQQIKFIRGFNEDHSSILESAEVSHVVNSLLEFCYSSNTRAK
ncbi:MAG: hypothetical protein GY694_22595 [Gammaproteobacteria bacterium]|nr:hypothetical protein [Gammaproteobacteria bacterium]